MTESSTTRNRKLKPWEKTWVNSKFVFKNPRCLKSRIPAVPTNAYDDWVKDQQSDIPEDASPEPSQMDGTPLDDVSMPKPKIKQPKISPYRPKETLKDWKQRHRKFVKTETPGDAFFPSRVGFVYSDLPMEPKREAERKLPDFPPGMTRAERRHWEAWAHV